MSATDNPHASLILSYIGSGVAYEDGIARMLGQPPDVVHELLMQMVQENMDSAGPGPGTAQVHPKWRAARGSSVRHPNHQRKGARLCGEHAAYTPPIPKQNVAGSNPVSRSISLSPVRFWT